MKAPAESGASRDGISRPFQSAGLALTSIGRSSQDAPRPSFAACAVIAPIVILTVSEDEKDLLDAVAEGAAGYLLKTTPIDELRAALRKAARGEPVFSPSLAALVIGEFRRLAKQAGASPISAREREVLQLVARGHSYGEIGGQLSISAKTVENHVRNILGKLQLSRRADLVRYAVEHGIG